jgi:NADH:ubiquinone oxidoreductase subunit 6 (subunit J)
MITRHNAARAALAFAVVILSTAGLFLLNAAPFLMAGTIIVYAGAIIVTFLFVLMLAQPGGWSDADARSREPLLAAAAGFFLLCTMLFVLRQTYDTADLDAVLATVTAARAQDRPDDIRRALGDAKEFEGLVDRALDPLAGRSAVTRPAHDAVDTLEADWAKDDVALLHKRLDLLAAALTVAQRSVGRLQPAEPTKLSPFAGTPANRPPEPVSADNVAGLGRALFTDYLLAVELAGTLLLVATIGAIAITHRTPAGRRAAP